MKDFIKELILSTIVAAILAMFNIIFSNSLKIWHYIVLVFVLFLLFIFIPKVFQCIVSFKNYLLKCFYPKIGILNGNIFSPVREYKCEKIWTKLTPSIWYSELIRQIQRPKRVKLLNIVELNSTYSMVINPFGDNFPEEDLKLHTTFYKICEYIKKGGIFICTGGSFYAHQNTLNSSKHETIIVKQINGQQNLSDTFFFQEFGAKTTGDNSENEKRKVQVIQNEKDVSIFGSIIDDKISVKRFRSITEISSDYLPIIREKGNKSFPACIIRYGEGYIVHFGMYLESSNSSEFSIIIKIINRVIKNNFKKF